MLKKLKELELKHEKTGELLKELELEIKEAREQSKKMLEQMKKDFKEITGDEL